MAPIKKGGHATHRYGLNIGVFIYHCSIINRGEEGRGRVANEKWAQMSSRMKAGLAILSIIVLTVRLRIAEIIKKERKGGRGGKGHHSCKLTVAPFDMAEADQETAGFHTEISGIKFALSSCRVGNKRQEEKKRGKRERRYWCCKALITSWILELQYCSWENLFFHLLKQGGEKKKGGGGKGEDG